MTLKRVAYQSIGIFRGPAARTLTALALACGVATASAQGPAFLPTVVTSAGNHTAGVSGDNGPATAAMLSAYIAGATQDLAGNVYIADFTNSNIRRVDARTAVITTFAGSSAGTSGFSGDGGPAALALLKNPQAVRYFQGGLWITDSGNNRIRRIDLTTGIINTLVGGGTNALNNANDHNNYLGPTISVPTPQDVAFDALGNMYWSQAGGTSRVDTYNIATGVTHIFAGTGGTGGATGTNIGAATNTLTQPELTAFNGPFGVVVDAQNNVYVVETATHVIRKITVGAVPTVSTYAGIGISGSFAICAGATDSLGDGCPATATNFGVASHMSIDGAGNIYLADSSDNRVRMIPPSANPNVGGTVVTISGNGAAVSTADGSYPLNTGISNPWDAQILPNGDLMVAERGLDSIRLMHLPGNFGPAALATSTTTQTVNALTQTAAGVFSLPAATDFTLANAGCLPGVNVTGNVCTATVTFAPTAAGLRQQALVFTDAGASAASGIAGVGLAPAASLLAGLTSTYAGTGTAGSTGDAGAAAGATLNAPNASTFDSKGNLYIADTGNNEIRRITPAGIISRFAGNGTVGSTGDGGAAVNATLSSPSGVAADSAGNLFIADTGNNKIRVVDAVSGNISTMAGTGAAGFTGDQSTPAAATLNGPTQLAFSQTGTLYVADTGNSAIRAIALKESLITTVAGTTTAGFDGDGGPGPQAQLQNPRGVAVDPSGNLFIADTGNNRIRLLSGGNISTLAGQQGAGFLGDGTASATELSAPAGLAVDSAGDLYIADTQNQRIRLLAGTQIYTVAGTGTAGSTGDGGTSLLATVSAPLALSLNAAGNLYLVDTGNNKVRAVNVGTNSLAFKTQNPGETSPVQLVSLFDSGNLPLTLASVTVPAGYTEQPSTGNPSCTSANTAPLTLATGTGCNLNTTFTPPAAGQYNGNITLTDNAQGVAAATQTIAVQGTSAFVFTAQLTLPSTATAGIAISGLLTAQNPQKTYTGTVKFTSTDPQATLPANYTYTAADAGAHTFAFTLKTAGPQCITATDTTDPTVTSTACTSVSAAAAAKVAVLSGNNQTANVGTAYSQHVIALVTDAFGNPVQKASVVFTIATGGTATGTFLNGTITDTEVSDLSGSASATTITAGPTVGPLTVTAALTGTTSTATFSLTVAVLGGFSIVPDSTTVGPNPSTFSTLSSVQLTITGASGFSAPVSLTCTAPTGTSCSVSPTVVGFNKGVEITRPALTFQGEGGLRGAGLGYGWSWPVAVVLAGLLLFARRRRRLTSLLAVAVALVALGAAVGCGQMYAPTTPNGSYVVTVTGTAQTASASTSVTFIVQN